ncbi:MAG: PDZ domain-containing protein [Woeseia sp.]
MSKLKKTVAVLLATALGTTAFAQQGGADGDTERSERQAQMSVAEEMRAAEARLEEAARRIAELSARQLPMRGEQRWAFAFSGRPMLGITLESDNNSGPVAGAVIRAVTPGGAAFEAGLRAGDIISAINQEAMSGATSAEANEKLLAFMGAVEDGDTLDIEYLRNGNLATVALQPKVNTEHRFSFGSPGHAPLPPSAPGAAMAPMPQMAPGTPLVREVFRWHESPGWHDMELTPLSTDLGKYFGTDKGLLVVRAPEGGVLQLKDGDVIQSIDGREPASISHAMRILASYQPGETIKLEIMRDKRRKTLDVALPDDRQSRVGATVAPKDFEMHRERHVN